MFDHGELDNAQKVFTEAIASAKAADDMQAEAEAEAFSGNIAYMQGQNDLGQRLTASALELSRKPGVSPSVRVRSAVYFAENREDLGYRSDENVRLLRFAVKEAQDNRLPARETANALYYLGSVLEVRGSLDEAAQMFNEALQVYGRDPLALCEQSEIYAELANIEDRKGDSRGSIPIYQRSYEGYKTCSGAESLGALTQHAYMSGALIKTGRAREAVTLLEGELPIWRRVVGSTPELSSALYFLGRAYVETGHFKEGEQAAREMVAVQEGKVSPTDRRIGISHLIWAKALTGQHRYQEALPHAVIADKLLAMGAFSVGAKQVAAEAHALLADIQSKLR
jgi:tetratricopeptide (TPR) repeat protein